MMIWVKYDTILRQLPLIQTRLFREFYSIFKSFSVSSDFDCAITSISLSKSHQAL